VLLAQLHVKPLVDRLIFASRFGDDLLPGVEFGFFAGLEADDRSAGFVLERRVFVETLLRLAIELFEVGDVRGRDARATKGDEHPELRAPVADVVLADDFLALELDDPRDRVADDRGPQVSDVHLFGDVGTGIVHHRFGARRRKRDGQSVVVDRGAEAL
jgi:hypothetical protein